MNIKTFTILTLATSFLFLSGCGPKKANPTPTPTPAPAIIEIPISERPYISLIPRTDGHELTLIIKDIPKQFTQLDYELLYTAADNGNEIEKGTGDTLKIDSPTIERKVLLGTASCTNGCKYKYDEGVNGGTLSLTFLSNNNQTASFETAFTLANTATIKKTGKLAIMVENFSISLKPLKDEFFILLKNYQPKYSVFSSGSGQGTVTSISPATITKTNLSVITGDYLIP